ncbi:MAG: glycosyltransferase [Rudaea sp.]|uniref:glycosyltransferase n=1 Tax=Rudaea sp. TaxID=2136325 RepID=UPI0039E5AF46
MSGYGHRINLIAQVNGVGLTRDMDLLDATLAAAGHRVSQTRLRGGKVPKRLLPVAIRADTAIRRGLGISPLRYDANILLEHVRDQYLPRARRNILLPNQEWVFPAEIALLGRIDHVLTKTRYAQGIFGALGRPSTYVGFTSPDRLDPAVPRRREFFHLAGRSRHKGTARLLALWQRHPHWPLLTVVQHPRIGRESVVAANINHRRAYMDDAELLRLQNTFRFHLCPSESEGFGHYIVEAMGIGAVVVTNDAPTMNEIVQPDRGVLIACRATEKKNLDWINEFDEAAMVAAVERLIVADDAELDRIGAAARAWYEDNDRGFAGRLRAGIAAAMA